MRSSGHELCCNGFRQHLQDDKAGEASRTKFVSTVLQYCADNNLQLTTQKTYSGDIVARLTHVLSPFKVAQEDLEGKNMSI